jgi:hypothetical protein
MTIIVVFSAMVLTVSAVLAIIGYIIPAHKQRKHKHEASNAAA